MIQELRAEAAHQEPEATKDPVSAGREAMFKALNDGTVPFTSLPLQPLFPAPDVGPDTPEPVYPAAKVVGAVDHDPVYETDQLQNVLRDLLKRNRKGKAAEEVLITEALGLGCSPRKLDAALQGELAPREQTPVPQPRVTQTTTLVEDGSGDWVVPTAPRATANGPRGTESEKLVALLAAAGDKGLTGAELYNNGPVYGETVKAAAAAGQILERNGRYFLPPHPEAQETGAAIPAR
jgi:hypothetical protein